MLGDSHQSDYYQLKHFGGRLHSPFVFVLMTEKVISNDRTEPEQNWRLCDDKLVLMLNLCAMCMDLRFREYYQIVSSHAQI